MPDDQSTVQALADAVATGRSVDWEAAERSADTVDTREVVRQLSVLATLTAVYQPEAAPQDVDQPSWWGRFESLKPIGAGTSGTVYERWDPFLERAVALKLLHSSRSDDRALSEARLLAKLRHPNVVTVYGADRVDGRLGLWMEFLTGRSLKEDVAARRPLSEHDAVLIGAELCRGLAAVHKAGLIHGDVKAQNVVREPDGRVVLTDFGAGVNHDAAADAALPVGGTPHYMAPELFEGRSVSVRSDVYSVGVLLFYLVTGQFPIVAATYDELAAGHKARRYRTVSQLRSGISPGFAAVVAQATATHPDGRFGSALEVETALQSLLRDDERRDHRGARRTMMAATAIVTAALAVVIWRLATPANLTTAVKSIAVLPFTNLSGNADEDYLADGMTEMLTSNLAQLNALRVTSRTSTMRFKNAHDAVPSIGQALHVDALVEGSLMHSGGRVRVTAQVIRVNTDEHVWAQTFERGDRDLFALEADLASAIAGAIKVAVAPAEHQRTVSTYAVNPAAQDAYMRGRYLIEQETLASERQALEYAKRAIQLDPAYPRGYALLARCYVRLAVARELPHDSAYASVYDAASRAIALDDSLADAHTELADILLYDRWDWVGSEREYQRAIDLNASHTLARSHYSRYLSAVGRHDRALQHARLTVDADPLSVEALDSVPLAMYYAGRFVEAAAAFRDTLRLFPNSAPTHFGLGRALAGGGNFDAADSELREASRLLEGYVNYKLERVRTLISAGRRREGLEQLAAIEAEHGPTSPLYLAYINAALGDREKTFDYLSRAVQERTSNLLWSKVDPRLAPVRRDPRFLQFLQTLAVP